MLIKRLLTITLAGLLITAGLGAGYTFADDDGDEYYENEERSRYGYRADLTPQDPVYSAECSSCHFLYQSWLLTARSWTRLMKNSSNHFGDDLMLDQEAKKQILAFLTANSADKAGNEWSYKITRSSRRADPDRITDVPYIRREHREISPQVFERPSVTSRSNCGACHQEAKNGNYEEDFVRIPK